LDNNYFALKLEEDKANKTFISSIGVDFKFGFWNFGQAEEYRLLYER